MDIRSFATGAAAIVVLAVVYLQFFPAQQVATPPTSGAAGDMPATEQQVLDEEGRPVSALDRLVATIRWDRRPFDQVATVESLPERRIETILPPITQYPLVVDPDVAVDDVTVEVFVTTHLSRAGKDGLHAEVARAFNASDVQLSSGRTARVKVRQIASGEGYSYIVSGRYRPDAFNPVHHLWAAMARERGVDLEVVRDRTVTSVAGVVMKTDTAAALRANLGREPDLVGLVDAISRRELAMGYTNPFVSSTGLDFLVSVLSTFSGGDEDAMLSPEVTSAFEAFQKGVPFVALTSLHMRESVTRGGSLDAFILGRRTFLGSATFASGYEFIPYGVGHTYPLYAVGTLSPEKREALERYAELMESERFRRLAVEYGWTRAARGDGHTPVDTPSGRTLLAAQALWKQKKDAGVAVAAVFVCDVSGSMDGFRIEAVKESLIEGSDFISPENYIGLVLFDDKVRTAVDIRKFDILQRGALHYAVGRMAPSGGTAMYDGIVAGLKMLEDFRAENPDVRPMLFVLTDGETMDGLRFDAVRDVIKTVGIPVHTIGYEAHIDELQRLSSLVEAASMKASVGKVGYTIGNMLNAQM